MFFSAAINADILSGAHISFTARTSGGIKQSTASRQGFPFIGFFDCSGMSSNAASSRKMQTSNRSSPVECSRLAMKMRRRAPYE